MSKKRKVESPNTWSLKRKEINVWRVQVWVEVESCSSWKEKERERERKREKERKKEIVELM